MNTTANYTKNLTGPFTGRDPVTSAVGEPYGASYAYALDRPTLFIDPSGLRWCWKACPVADGLGSAVKNSAPVKAFQRKAGEAMYDTAYAAAGIPISSGGVEASGIDPEASGNAGVIPTADEGRRPGFQLAWTVVRIGGAACACYEGAEVGAMAGPWGAAAGCVAVALAFDVAAENGLHIIEGL
jgi:hypothetical protein